MARFRPADAAPSKRDRVAMKRRAGSMAKMEEYGEDPWTVGNGRDAGRVSTVKSLPAAQDDVDGDDKIALPTPVALPTPIAATVPLGKIVTADGRELPYYQEIPGFVYQPLPGFEHCFNAGTPAGRANETRVRAASPRTANAVSAPKLPTQKTLKRSRRQQSPVQASSEDDDYDRDDGRDVTVTTEQSYSFYIGNVAQLKLFFRRRFDELTTRPLRTIVTAWIKQLEPRRLGGYGPYHKQLPTEQPPECTPPWWPRDIPYNEPSHLSKGNLQSLAVDVMLQHRNIDQVKRRGSWVAKLRQAAQCAVEMTTSEVFSSSKRTEFSEKMKERALEFILPSLFDVAQSYEDHLAQYDLYEDGNTDAGEGRYITWQHASRPPRQTPQRKRARTARAPPALTVDCHGDASADETEVDDTISNSFLRRDQARARKHARTSQESNNPTASQQAPASPIHAAAVNASPPAGPKQDFPPSTSIPTPNMSFHPSLDDLHLGEGMDMSMDVKGGDAMQYHDPAMIRNMFALSQPMQYSNTHPGYINQVFPPQETAGSFCNSAQSSFSTAAAPGYANPFHLFNAPYSPQVGHAAFGASMASNHAGFPYEYEGVFPPTTMLGNADGSFHGLPHDLKYDVANQGRGHD